MLQVIVLWLLARNDHNKAYICKSGGVQLVLHTTSALSLAVSLAVSLAASLAVSLTVLNVVSAIGLPAAMPLAVSLPLF